MDEGEQVATDGMRLPDRSTLRDAVKEVIRQNQEVGYNPGRFIQATQNGESNLVNDHSNFDVLVDGVTKYPTFLSLEDLKDLVSLCQNLVNDHSNFDVLVDGVTKYPTFLSLEDLITHSRYGREWGLDDSTVVAA